LKIAICVNSFYPSTGGCEIVTGKIADYLYRQHEVTIFTRHLLKRKSKKLNDISIIGYNQSNPNSFITTLKKFSPDFILIYSDLFDFFHVVISEFDNVCVAFCGGNRLCDRSASLQVFKNKINNIKSFVCHTKSERDYKLAKSLNILDRTHVIPNGIDLEEFDDNGLTRKDLIPDQENTYWVLNVSNFFPGKGQLHLIPILSKLKTKPITYIQVCSSLDFALGRHLEQQWKAKAISLSKIGIKVILMKDKSRKEVVGIFKNSNVFAFPSEKESAGLVLLEAMASSIPWVSTNVGISPELEGGHVVTAVKNKSYNSIFDDRVINSFANKLDECLKNPQKSNEGRVQVENDFQWKNILPEYGKLL